ncbi:MAG: hypothetical protein JNK34_10080 [Tabrizicola sp.]|nr:hypothetical protein [Tabrizicola sp.]
MAFRQKTLLGLLVAVLPASANAECLGSCMDSLVGSMVSMLVYLVIGIVLLVMLIRAKWRKAGLRALVAVAVLALVVPLISQAWVAWKLRGVEAREIVGEPPAMATRTPLLITPDDYCQDSACEAVLIGRSAAGAYVLPAHMLDGLDVTKPLALADLPLELWLPPGTSGEERRRELTPDERHEAALRIDYLIFTTWSYHVPGPGQLEAGLRGNAVLSGMDAAAGVRLMLAPLDPATGVLDLTVLKPDLLDLSLQDRALAIPLALANTQAAGNSNVGTEIAARSICPLVNGETDATCLSLIDR